MTNLSAFFDEFLGTVVLIIAVFAIDDKNNNPPPSSLKSLVLFLLILGIGASIGMQTDLPCFCSVNFRFIFYLKLQVMRSTQLEIWAHVYWPRWLVTGQKYLLIREWVFWIHTDFLPIWYATQPLLDMVPHIWRTIWGIPLLCIPLHGRG